MEERYNRKLLAFGPQAASSREEFEKLYGKELWKTDPDFYQYLTKVEPTARALELLKVDVWITGRRRTQGDARSDLEVVEIDADGRLKINPLAFISWTDIENYISENKVPYNALLDRGYKSIGDFHSTIAISDDAPERAGRWAGSGRTECGMHSKHRSTSAPAILSSSAQLVTLKMGIFSEQNSEDEAEGSGSDDDARRSNSTSSEPAVAAQAAAATAATAATATADMTNILRQQPVAY